MIRSYKKNGYTIEVTFDEYAQSPDEYFGDDELFIVAFHRSFTVTRKGFSKEEIEEQMAEVGVLWKNDKDSDYEFTPLYGYVHSGVSVSLTPFGCRWDAGQIGWVVRKKGSLVSETAFKALVRSWDMYCQSEVYVCTIKDRRGDTIESCGNLYGDEAVEAFVEDSLPSKSCEAWTEKEAIEYLRACLQNLLDRSLITGVHESLVASHVDGNDHVDEVRWCLEKTEYWAEKEAK